MISEWNGLRVVGADWLAAFHDDGYDEALAKLPSYVPIVLKGMRNRRRNLDIVKRLLEGATHTQLLGEGFPSWSVRSLQRRLTLVGVRCPCSRRLNHQGACRFRRQRFQWRSANKKKTHCPFGHPLSKVKKDGARRCAVPWLHPRKAA